jgi:uncharacterized protein YecE (DUF72 family)
LTEFQNVLFGTAGWSYEDWKGAFYPEKPPSRFDYLRFAAGKFDALEINSTFYRPPTARMAKSWVRRTADLKGFEFTAKLHERFTHRRGEQWTEAEAAAYKEGIDPLQEAGKLGGILLQFPWSFKNTPESRKWLEAVVEEFREYPLFLEVRHKSWASDDFFHYLDEAGVGFVDVDQPLFSGSLPPTERVTAKRSYVRLHGQNKEKWFDENAQGWQRYDYLYSEDELAKWVTKIRDLSRKAEKVFVFNNNHYRGQAAANSLELKNLLTGEKLPVPPDLLATYPRLSRIAAPQAGETQPRLL